MIVRKVATLLAGAVLLTGCGETTAGVAARIGGEAIETSSFASRVATAYENEEFAQQQPREEYQRQLLRDMIMSRLVDRAARRLGVTVPDAEVEKALEDAARQYGGRQQFEQFLPTRGLRLSDARDILRTRLLEERILDKLVEDVPVSEDRLRQEYRKLLPQYDTAEIAHILLHDAATARTIARRARSGSDFGALARRHSQDPDTRDEGGELGRVGNGEGRFSAEFERAVFGAKTGDIVGPIRIRLEGDVTGYEIVKVIDRQTRSFDAVRDEIRRVVLRNQRIERYNTLLGDIARELGIKVNPRFGAWDQQRLQVVPPQGGLSSPAPVPGEQPAGVVPPQPSAPAGQPTPGAQ